MHELPLFFDSTGKRWQRLKFILIVSAFTVALGILALLMAATSGAYVPAAVKRAEGLNLTFPAETRPPDKLAYALPDDLPIIGRGVFMQVVRLQAYQGKVWAVEVYTGQVVRPLETAELAAVGSHTYALEKYGAASGKQMVLTFDDGPHPVYTPQILDILSAEQAHSTFFPTGENLVKYPGIGRRMAREGHDVANHTFSHADLDLVNSAKAAQEINQTQRIIHAVTGHSSALFRIPYGGNDDASLRDDKRAVLEAQKQGYLLASYDIDSKDWEFTSGHRIEMPKLDGTPKVVLLHDGGGDRTGTVEYLEQLIKQAKADGYTFTSLSRLYSDYRINQDIRANPTDYAVYYAAQATLVWPKRIIGVLFVTSVTMVFVTVILGIIMAELQMLMYKPRRRRAGYRPLASVIIPAYNEEKVLRKTVASILRSSYRNIEVIIIDDGSSDGTWELVQKLRRHPKVRGYRQKNAGKAVAVNRGIAKARGDIFISVDADTVFARPAIGKMVRHFYYPSVGAVAGVVKVGNAHNWITRWQALEYITSINIERTAQAFMRSILIAPGACSAWRKSAVLQVGGYSSSTMAEDCDLTLSIHKAGYNVVQDLEAMAYTESPETIRALAKQRFRWLFGMLQSMWKHRDMVMNRRYGLLGTYVIPKTLLGLIVQLLFAPLLLAVGISNLISGNIMVILLYSAIAFAVLLLTAVAAVLLARERLWLVSSTPAFRLIYSPLRCFILYAAVLAMFGGFELGWNKLARTGSVTLNE